MKVNELTEPCFIMTVDVDSWSSLLKFYDIDYDPLEADHQASVEDGVHRLLQLFNRHNIKATFFVPGEVAQRHSIMVKTIAHNGHEVACHGFNHDPNECLLSEAKQKQAIHEATYVIEQVAGMRPKGFRAPCLRLNETTITVLTRCGYTYDSSVLPTFIPGYYGFLLSPSEPYYPSPTITNRKGTSKLLELPVSVNPLVPLPLSGAWMRNLGATWVKFGVKMNFIRGHPVVFYVHPRDVVSLPEVHGVPWHLYRNVGNCAIKMVDEIICHAKELRARFMRATDFVQHWKLHLEKS